MLVNQKEYAARKGWSAPYVCQLVKQGKIRLVGKKIDVKATDKALEEIALDAPRTDAPQVADPGRESKQLSYIEARTYREQFLGLKEQLRYEQLQGKLVDADLVLEKASTAFQNTRLRLRGLARSMAPILASHNSPTEIEKLLSDGIEGALETLSEDVFK